MTEPEKVKVKVPTNYGTHQTFRFSGGEPKNLQAHDGIVHVPRQYLNQFLSIVKGSHLVDGNPIDEHQQGES